MKFVVPNYSCLQNPWLGGYRPPDPRSLCPLSWTEFVEHPRTKFLGTPLIYTKVFQMVLSPKFPHQNSPNVSLLSHVFNVALPVVLVDMNTRALSDDTVQIIKLFITQFSPITWSSSSVRYEWRRGTIFPQIPHKLYHFFVIFEKKSYKFWKWLSSLDAKQRVVASSYRRFRTTWRSLRQG